jgi:hypothetical protein
MKLLLVGALGSLALGIFGCGGSGNGGDGGGGGGGNSFGCTSGTGTARLCIDTTTNFSGTPTCSGGTLSDACPHAGADGGCKMAPLTVNGASLNQTAWYYTGSAASTSQEMSDCADFGGTWIQP